MEPARLDGELLECLQDVIDLEVGVSIVDLGLVYAATRTPHAIDVAFMLTNRACPLGSMIVQNIRDVLARRYPRAQLDVRLVWVPPWKPDRITSRGRFLLGRRSHGAEL